jgi:hypothetical protein
MEERGEGEGWRKVQKTRSNKAGFTPEMCKECVSYKKKKNYSFQYTTQLMSQILYLCPFKDLPVDTNRESKSELQVLGSDSFTE